jgi:hypothetical protein
MRLIPPSIPVTVSSRAWSSVPGNVLPQSRGIPAQPMQRWVADEPLPESYQECLWLKSKN